MALHSSTLAWKIPRTEEPGSPWGPAVLGSLRVGHNCTQSCTSLSFFTFMHWRRKWQPTPVFLPGESQERGSLVGCRLWGLTESDTTEATQQQQSASRIHNLKTLQICLHLTPPTYASLFSEALTLKAKLQVLSHKFQRLIPPKL